MRTTPAVLLCALAVSCSSPDSSPTPGRDPIPTPGDPVAPARTDNGQTGSPQYVCTEADCAATAQMTLSSLTQSVTPPTFVGSSCHPPDTGPARLDTRSTVYCRCDQSDGGVFVLSDPSPAAECEVRGRGGFCIFDNSDFAGCDPSDSHSCESPCSVLQGRLAADAAKTFSAEIRFSGCMAPPAGSVLYTEPRCGTVLRVDDRCYTNDFQGWVLAEEPVDCALSDQEILSPGSSTGGDAGERAADASSVPQQAP